MSILSSSLSFFDPLSLAESGSKTSEEDHSALDNSSSKESPPSRIQKEILPVIENNSLLKPHFFTSFSSRSVTSLSPDARKIEEMEKRTNNLILTYLIDNRIDNLILTYLEETNAEDSKEISCDPDIEENVDETFEFLDTHIDRITQGFLAQETFQEDINTLIREQKAALSPFEKTINKNGERYIERLSLPLEILDELEALQEQMSNPCIVEIIQEYQRLRATNLDAYHKKKQLITKLKWGNILDFFTKPRYKITTPIEAFTRYLLCKSKFPSQPKMHSEYFTKWIKETHLYQNLNCNCIDYVMPIAQKYNEEGTALKYFSDFGLSIATKTYTKFALKQFKIDFKRTSKIVFEKYHINNKDVLSDVVFSHSVTNWSFKTFIRKVYKNCFLDIRHQKPLAINFILKSV